MDIQWYSTPYRTDVMSRAFHAVGEYVFWLTFDLPHQKV